MLTLNQISVKMRCWLKVKKTVNVIVVNVNSYLSLYDLSVYLNYMLIK